MPRVVGTSTWICQQEPAAPRSKAEGGQESSCGISGRHPIQDADNSHQVVLSYSMPSFVERLSPWSLAFPKDWARLRQRDRRDLHWNPEGNLSRYPRTRAKRYLRKKKEKRTGESKRRRRRRGKRNLGKVPFGYFSLSACVTYLGWGAALYSSTKYGPRLGDMHVSF